MLALGTGSAFAAGVPEEPETTKASAITANSAVLEGVLNPKNSATAGWYFAYTTEIVCAMGARAPESPATEETVKDKIEKIEVKELQPNREYTFCIVATNAEGETPSAKEVKFTTKAAPAEIVSESVSNVKATEATLEGTVNPNNQLTECHFQYGKETLSVHVESSVPCTPVSLEAVFEDKNVSPTEVNETGQTVPKRLTGLEPDTTYHYRIATKNGKGEEAVGPEKEFKRVAAPPEKPVTEEAKQISNTTAELHGIVNPTTPSSVSWFFQYAIGSSCTAADVSTTPAQGSEEVQAHAAEANAAGLRPHTEYTVCLVAENESKEKTVGGAVSFTTTALAPSVDDEYISQAGFADVTLTAKINPHGSPAMYHFEYGISGASGASTATRPLAAAESDVTATAELTGLQPGTDYQARVVVEDESGSTVGAPFSFTTDATTAAPLPDGRVYEMVSPPQNQDADIYAPGLQGYTGNGGTGSPFQAAANGEAITYVGESVSGGNGSSGSGGFGGTRGDKGGVNFTGNQLLARRSASGWTQEVIAATGRAHSFYEAFSEDLSTGILRAGSFAELTALLPEAESLGAGYRVLYTRNDKTQAEHALFTQFTQMGQPGIFGFFPRFVGASADFSTMVFDANAALTPGAPAGSHVYESKGGQPSLINVLPDGTVEPSAQAGGVEEAGAEEEGSPEFSRAVSADGSRVVWTGTGSHPNLYMHRDAAATVQVDASQAGGVGGGGHFWTASSDGEKVFFTDDAAAGLTSDTVSGSGANLYEYDVGDRKLTDLTTGPDARVQGVIGATEDGSYVYFVADGALAEGTTTGTCEGWAGSLSARCNLYVRHDGTTTFVSSLSQNDGLLVSNTTGITPGGGGGIEGDWVTGVGLRTADVAADGAVVFDSDLSLTGYRNEGAKEVYVYDPATGGELTCVSCDPSGAPPLTADVLKKTQIAGLLPVSHDTSHATRVISADGGRVFFDAAVPLLPQDTNRQMDVYEWERDGAGTCTLAKGCLSLLTGGKSDAGSFLLDSSLSGDDVFVVTRAQLAEQDRNENYDVYDVRVDGVRQATPPSCSGTGCQGVPLTPPTFATPSSVTFSGTGNFLPRAPGVVKPKAKSLTRAQKLVVTLRACRKKSAKRARVSCEASAQKKYGATKKKAKKSTSPSTAKGSK
ncbi:MAG TPA: hypothetical protein VGG98_01425 [Solirubrobacteraceae bacterium]